MISKILKRRVLRIMLVLKVKGQKETKQLYRKGVGRTKVLEQKFLGKKFFMLKVLENK